jgi:hypothetical protein
MPAVIDRRYGTGSNEVETGKYSGSWLPRPRNAKRILFPAFTVLLWRQLCRLLLRMQAARLPLQRLALGNRIQSQQRNCSRISRDSSRRSTTATNKELPPEVAACAWALKIYFAVNVAGPRNWRFEIAARRRLQTAAP